MINFYGRYITLNIFFAQAECVVIEFRVYVIFKIYDKKHPTETKGNAMIAKFISV